MNKKREIILYIIFGVLTTLVYFVTRFTVFSLFKSGIISVIIAQIISILFAFITNKLFVFQNKVKETKYILFQFIKFIFSRFILMLFDIIITYIAVDKYSSFFINLFDLNNIDYQNGIFGIKFLYNYIGSNQNLNAFIFAILVQIITIVGNYLFSKLLVFKNNKIIK